jgi:hypothetical protein
MKHMSRFGNPLIIIQPVTSFCWERAKENHLGDIRGVLFNKQLRMPGFVVENDSNLYIYIYIYIACMFDMIEFIEKKKMKEKHFGGQLRTSLSYACGMQ